VDRRRVLLTSLAGAVAGPLAAGAQAGKVYRIGVLSPDAPPPGLFEAFQEGLRESWAMSTGRTSRWNRGMQGERRHGRSGGVQRRCLQMVTLSPTPRPISVKTY